METYVKHCKDTEANYRTASSLVERMAQEHADMAEEERIEVAGVTTRKLEEVLVELEQLMKTL